MLKNIITGTETNIDIQTKLLTLLHSNLALLVLYLLQDPKPQKVLLSGYGVELAIKSTEYKAVDDTKVKGWLVLYQAVSAGSYWARAH